MKVGATFHKFVASSAALDQSLTAACSRPAEGFWSLSTTQRWHPQWMQCFRMRWIWQNQAVFTCFKQPEWGFKQRYNKSDSDPTKCWYLLDVNWCSTNGAVGSKMASQNGWINTKEIQNWWGFEPHFRWFNHVQFQTLLLTLNLHINWLTEQSILCLEKEIHVFVADIIHSWTFLSRWFQLSEELELVMGSSHPNIFDNLTPASHPSHPSHLSNHQPVHIGMIIPSQIFVLCEENSDFWLGRLSPRPTYPP